MSFRSTCAGLAALAALAGCAPSPPPRPNVILQANLLGTWAVNCERPASRANMYQTVSSTGQNAARIVYQFGPGRPDNVYAVNGAEWVAPDQVMLHQVFENTGRAQDALVLLREGRMTVWWSQRDDGSVAVADGVRTGGHGANPWLTRCGI